MGWLFSLEEASKHPRRSAAFSGLGAGAGIALISYFRVVDHSLGYAIVPGLLASIGVFVVTYQKFVVTYRDTRYLPGGGRMDDPATVYYSRRGGYVVRNNRTGDIVQVSKRTDPGWTAPWDR
ncbi:MAG: colicin E5-related ribonuclease [Gaiellaceae bacterium]